MPTRSCFDADGQPPVYEIEWPEPAEVAALCCNDYKPRIGETSYRCIIRDGWDVLLQPIGDYQPTRGERECGANPGGVEGLRPADGKALLGLDGHQDPGGVARVLGAPVPAGGQAGAGEAGAPDLPALSVDVRLASDIPVAGR